MKNLEFLLNDCLNSAMCTHSRIKGIPDSNKIAEFVNKFMLVHSLEVTATVNSTFNLERLKKEILTHLVKDKKLKATEIAELTGMSESTLYRTLFNFNIQIK